ncbi:hypothetical protein SUGI_0192950 [Cryptomeria japonica]|nr:hypothetical protein SUGI_0192950 [Cryptomeria japonica]
MKPAALWNRYLDWLYQHKELGLYIDVSRIGFRDEFMEAIEPKFQSNFKALEELEAGSIANLDEGCMAGHYWLSKSSIAPNPNLWQQIDRTLDTIYPWVAQTDARDARCTGTALSVAMGLVGAYVHGTAARIMLFIGDPSTQGSDIYGRGLPSMELRSDRSSIIIR